MKARTTTAIAALLTLLASAAQAQNPGRFSLELRAGTGLPTEELGAQDLDPAFAFGLAANLQVMPHLNLYAAHNQVHFGLQENVGAFDEFENCGYALGARFFTRSLGPVTPFLMAGATLTQLEFEGEDDDADLDTDHAWGWEAGGGAAVALGGRWSLLPGVRYHASSHELAELGGDVDLSYVSFDIGFSATFGGPSIAAIRHH